MFFTIYSPQRVSVALLLSQVYVLRIAPTGRTLRRIYIQGQRRGWEASDCPAYWSVCDLSSLPPPAFSHWMLDISANTMIDGGACFFTLSTFKLRFYKGTSKWQILDHKSDWKEGWKISLGFLPGVTDSGTKSLQAWKGYAKCLRQPKTIIFVSGTYHFLTQNYSKLHVLDKTFLSYCRHSVVLECVVTFLFSLMKRRGCKFILSLRLFTTFIILSVVVSPLSF